MFTVSRLFAVLHFQNNSVDSWNELKNWFLNFTLKAVHLLPYPVQCRIYCKKTVINFTIIQLYLEQQLCTVQWDYGGNWDTTKNCKSYIEYICGVYKLRFKLRSETNQTKVSPKILLMKNSEIDFISSSVFYLIICVMKF